MPQAPPEPPPTGDAPGPGAEEAPIRGSCQCGQITYTLSRPPIGTLVCHCKDCQKLSASAYSPTLILHRGSLEVQGETATYVSEADSGTTKIAHFCPTCGNRIYHVDPRAPEHLRLKAGTLDGTPIPEPIAHVWTCRKQAWVEIPPGVARFEKGASRDDLQAALRARG